MCVRIPQPPLANVADYAEIGAKFGARAAEGARRLPADAARDAFLTEARLIAGDYAAGEVRGGATEDEAEIYRESFRRVLEAGLALPPGGGMIRVRVLAGSRSRTVEVNVNV